MGEIDFGLFEASGLLVLDATRVGALKDVLLRCGDFVELFGCNAEVLC
jgi:hypothetical protein